MDYFANYKFKLWQEKILTFLQDKNTLIIPISFVILVFSIIINFFLIANISALLLFLSLPPISNHFQLQLKRFFKFYNGIKDKDKISNIASISMSFLFQLFLFILVSLISLIIVFNLISTNINTITSNESLVILLMLVVFPIINFSVNYFLRWWFKYSFNPRATDLFCSLLSFIEVAIISTLIASFSILSDLIKENLDEIINITNYSYTQTEYRTLLFFLLEYAFLSCYCTRKATISIKID